MRHLLLTLLFALALVAGSVSGGHADTGPAPHPVKHHTHHAR